MRPVLLSLLLLLLAGCAHRYAPPGNLPFRPVTADLLAGCWALHPDGAQEPALELDQLLGLPRGPRKVDALSIVRGDDGALVARSQAGRDVLFARRLGVPEAGGEYAGRVLVENRLAIVPFERAHSPDNPFIGPQRERLEVGLDTAGNLKVRNSGWFAGLVYLVIPMAVRASDEYRFPRAACP